MATYQPPVRVYTFSDAHLVGLCIEKSAYAERDAAELLTKGIDAAFVTDLVNRALAFAATPDDAVERAEQTEATATKDETIDLLRDKMKELRSTVGRAYGVESGTYNKFNLIYIDKLNDEELVARALIVKEQAVAHAADLALKGWDAADNTELADLITEYVGDKKEQSDEISNRDTAQETRVKEGNAIYDLLENQLCAAGKEYWRTVSAAKYNDYLIYDNGSGSNPNNVTYSGTISDNATGALLAGATLTFGTYQFTTNAAGEFSGNVVITEPTVFKLTIVKTGYVIINTTVQFSPGTNLPNQTINMQRVILNTFQQIITMGNFTLGNTPAGSTGLRIKLLSGSQVTVGYSNNGTNFSGNTETVTILNFATDRTNSELNGPDIFVMAQNNTPGNVEVRVDVLG